MSLLLRFAEYPVGNLVFILLGLACLSAAVFWPRKAANGHTARLVQEGMMMEQSLKLTIEVRIDQGSYPGLQIRETVELPMQGFMECAAVLGKFHELTQTLKANATAKK